MSSVGRNDPCPCGSGKKFKKCCLDKARSADVEFTPDERSAALEELLRFADRAEFEDDRVMAEDEFWEDRLDDLDDDEADEIMSHDQSVGGFQEWFALDWIRDDGQTVLELFLARHGDRLRPGERRYLARLPRTHIRPYEVTAVRLDEGLDLVDLWTNQRIRVRERQGTQQLAQWDVIAARVAPDPSGELVLEGMPYRYPPIAKAPLLEALRGLRREYRRDDEVEDDGEFFKDVGCVYHHVWLDRVALPPSPKLVTAEGDDMVFARVVFDVRDRDTVRSALERHPDIVHEGDGGFVWVENDARTLGVFWLEEKRLTFEATSESRGERGRSFIETLAGDAVVYRATGYEGIERARKRIATAPRFDAARRDSHQQHSPPPPRQE